MFNMISSDTKPFRNKMIIITTNKQTRTNIKIYIYISNYIHGCYPYPSVLNYLFIY